MILTIVLEVYNNHTNTTNGNNNNNHVTVMIIVHKINGNGPTLGGLGEPKRGVPEHPGAAYY